MAKFIELLCVWSLKPAGRPGCPSHRGPGRPWWSSGTSYRKQCRARSVRGGAYGLVIRMETLQSHNRVQLLRRASPDHRSRKARRGNAIQLSLQFLWSFWGAKEENENRDRILSGPFTGEGATPKATFSEKRIWMVGGYTHVVAREVVDVGLAQHAVVLELRLAEGAGVGGDQNQLGLALQRKSC